MRIEDTKFASEFGEVRERRAAMAARVARLEAEAQGQSKVVIPARACRRSRRTRLRRRDSVFETRARKIAQDIDVLAQEETRLTESLKLLNRELELTRPLSISKRSYPKSKCCGLTARRSRNARPVGGNPIENHQHQGGVPLAGRRGPREVARRSCGARREHQVGAGPGAAHRAQVAGLRHHQQAQRHHGRRGRSAGRQSHGYRAAR